MKELLTILSTHVFADEIRIDCRRQNGCLAFLNIKKTKKPDQLTLECLVIKTKKYPTQWKGSTFYGYVDSKKNVRLNDV